MWQLDGIVFTAGIGENSPEIRHRCCSGLKGLGIEIDTDKNNQVGDDITDIATSESKVKILVIPTNEELKIAIETQKVIQKGKRSREPDEVPNDGSAANTWREFDEGEMKG